jgi:hypothetical protein
MNGELSSTFRVKNEIVSPKKNVSEGYSKHLLSPFANICSFGKSL